MSTPYPGRAATILAASLILLTISCGTTKAPDVQARCDETLGEAATEADWTALDEPIQSIMARAHIPGLAAAVVKEGRVVWTGAYGWANVETRRPVTVDTPFMLASVSKTFTAVALMQMIEAGRLTLDDQVNDRLGFPVDNPRVEGEVITLRHLASHTSGIQDNWDNMPYAAGDSPHALGDYLAGYLVSGGTWYDPAANFYPWQPGAQAEYSNIATALAGLVVEVVGGRPFDAHCEAEILGPLGMTHSGWHLSDFDPNDVAVPYEWADGDYDAYEQYGFPSYPDGQMRSSAGDLARFLAAISAGGAFEGQRILQEATVAQMLSQQAPGVDDEQFVFWFSTELCGRTVVGHDGADDGASTRMYFDPATGIGALILMNAEEEEPVDAAGEALLDLLFDAAEGRWPSSQATK